MRRSSWWVLLNLVGMGVYLRLAAELWVLPGEEGQPGGPGDAFYWLFFLVPVLAVYLLLNLVVLFLFVRRRRGQDRKRVLVRWCVVAVLWLVVVAYDHHRAFRVIRDDSRESSSEPRQIASDMPTSLILRRAIARFDLALSSTQ